MQHHDGVHLETQVDSGAGVGVVFGKGHVAVVIGFHLAEPVQVGGQVFLAQAILGQFVQKAGETVAMAVVVPLAKSVPSLWT